MLKVETKVEVQSGRQYRLWEFRVSHNQLLLRSPMREGEHRNHDLIFVGVDYLAMPTTLTGIEVHRAEDDDVRELESKLGRAVAPTNAYALVSGGRRHLLVAAAMQSIENELDIFESSLESF